MRRKDIDAVLASMSIIADTREQDTDRSRRRLQAVGCPVSRAVLDYGDYAANAVLPDGSPLMDESKRLFPKCVIERKMNLDELAMCFTTARERFRKEFERAREHGARIWLICENSSWEAVYQHRYRSNMMPKAFVGSLTAFANRYNAMVIFCSDITTPLLIREILYRDLKERLEGGELDGRPEQGVDKAVPERPG